MELFNHTPFAMQQWTSLGDQQQPQGVLLLKGTFAIRHQGEGIFQLQPDASAGRLYSEDQMFVTDRPSALRVESDFTALKPTTDITANACAFAPQGQPARSWQAGMQIAQMPPAMVQVYGPRHWHRLLGTPIISRATPCRQVLLRYENAFGGQCGELRSPMNPVGCGYWPVSKISGNPRAHQVEWADQLIHERAAKQPQPPAGFGALHRSWQPRLTLAGSYDAAWRAAEQPQHPQDRQQAYHLAGCAQLRPERYLQGGETIQCFNLTPEAASARLQLPQYDLQWQLDSLQGHQVSGRCFLDSLHFEMENGLHGAQLTMSWRGVWPCHLPAASLRASVRSTAT